MTTHKKLADQITKRWIIADAAGNIFTTYDNAEFFDSLADAKGTYEEALNTRDLDPDDGTDWFIQEVTFGTKYILEQEPKWKEVK